MAQTSVGPVFMSYSRTDEAVMQRIASFLRKRDINVWVDNEKLKPGTPIWEAEIEKAIKAASAVIVILSPDSKNSEWVRREITLADQYHTRIFPVLVRGDEESSITLRLITRQYVDLRLNENVGLKSLRDGLTVYIEELKSQERSAIEETERLAREKQQRETARRAAEYARLEKAQQEAAEKAAREKAEQKATEIEKTKREASEKAAREKIEDVTSKSPQQKSIWREFTKALRVFAGTSLVVEVLLDSFGLVETFGASAHWGWTTLQIVLGILAAIVAVFGEEDVKEPSSTKQSVEKLKSNDSIWLRLASHVWGLVGSVLWAFIIFMTEVLYLSKFNFNIETDDRSGFFSFVMMLFAIIIGIERWVPWKNSARKELMEF